MRTKDSISKKRQKLHQEIEFWEARARQVAPGLGLSAPPQEFLAGAVLFCRQEAAKRRAALKRLATTTRWQRINGWQ